MKAEWISSEHIIIIVTAICVGTLARIFTLKEDFRQYPSYPNGYMIQLVTGFVAASLGAVAIPALMTKNFIAVTFLTLAVQQFREVRKAERESLQDLEDTEYTYRGKAYIDGIAKTFEARNYLALVVSFTTALTMEFVHFPHQWGDVIAGVITGSIMFYLLKRFSKGKTIGDIAKVEAGNIEVRDGELYVEGLFVSNLLGTDQAEELFQKEGLAVVITPHEPYLSLTLSHFGQRQAALFEATRAIGLKRYHFTRRNFTTGQVVITLVPMIDQIDRFIESVKQTPLLESTKKSESVMDTKVLKE